MKPKFKIGEKVQIVLTDPNESYFDMMGSAQSHGDIVEILEVRKEEAPCVRYTIEDTTGESSTGDWVMPENYLKKLK